ncbi:hypothetical protein QQ020_14840 [Fulvivirgaceae bacterium BMA12]|uniref:PH domain-containing protein n=1 Tax=Agaribacillus aureus TaxID=3051825 RepID=A0ABT8L6H1_9BACT|nr:hypothetical protein [Fulvivirgaceae bacterium BMA12]
MTLKGNLEDTINGDGFGDNKIPVPMTLKYKLGAVQLRQFLVLPLTKLIGVVVVFTFLATYWFGVRAQDMIVVVAITWVWVGLIHILPLLILAAYHYRRSKNSFFNLDSISGEYTFNNGIIELKFKLEEIERVVKVVSPPKYDKRMDFLGVGYFYYWKIILNDCKILPISCMLVNEDTIFDGRKIEFEKRMFPIPPLWA